MGYRIPTARRTTVGIDAGLNALLDRLAQREVIGERAKDRALEREKINYDLERLKQQGAMDRAQQNLAVLQANLQAKLAMKQADTEAARIQLQGEQVNSEIIERNQRLYLARKTFEMQAAEHSLRLENSRTETSIAKERLLLDKISANDRRQEHVEKMRVHHQGVEMEQGANLSSIFLYQKEDGSVEVVPKYKNMFDNLMAAYGVGDPRAILNRHILPMLHRNMQLVAEQNLRGTGITDINDERVPNSIKERVVNDALVETFGGAPSELNPTGGIFYASALGRMGPDKAMKLRAKMIKRYGETEGLKRYHAKLIGSHQPYGDFTGDPMRTNVEGYDTGHEALMAAKATAQQTVDALVLRPVMNEVLPTYSSHRKAREAATQAYVELEKQSRVYATLMNAELGAVGHGNPDGLTPQQFRDVGYNTATTQEQTIFGSYLSPEEVTENLRRAQSQEGVDALLKDARVEAIKPEKELKGSEKTAAKVAEDVVSALQKPEPSDKYGLPGVAENVWRNLGWANNLLETSISTGARSLQIAGQKGLESIEGTPAYGWMVGRRPAPDPGQPNEPGPSVMNMRLPAPLPRASIGSPGVPLAQVPEESGGPGVPSAYNTWVSATNTLKSSNAP